MFRRLRLRCQVDLSRYFGSGGAYNNSTDCTPALTAALAAISSAQATLQISGQCAFASSKTIPPNVVLQFLSPGEILPATTKTITIQGPVLAPVKQIFGGAGSISFSPGSYVSGGQHIFYPEWWGAVGDGSTDDYAALNAAQTACSVATGELILSAGGYSAGVPTGGYDFNTTIHVQPDCEWVGKGKGFATVLLPNTTAYLSFDGASVSGGFALRNIFRDLMIWCGGTTAVNCVSLNSAYEIFFQNVFINHFNYGGGANTNIVGLSVLNCTQCSFENLTVYGDNEVTGTSIIIGTGAAARFDSVDVENDSIGFYITSTAQASIYSGYTERYGIYGVKIDRSGVTGQVQIFGGDYLYSGGATAAIGLLTGAQNVSIYNPEMLISSSVGIDASSVTARLINVNVYGVDTGMINDPNNAIAKFSSTEITNLWQDTLYSYKKISSRSISGISKAASAVITLSTGSATNPYAVNQVVLVNNVSGMTQINGLYGTISGIGGSSGAWTITVNINSSGFSVWTSGGVVNQAELPIFTLNIAAYGVMDCELDAFASLSIDTVPYSKQSARVRFMATNPAGTAQVSLMSPLGPQIDESTSGNWQISLSYPVTFNGVQAIAATSGTLSANWTLPTGVYMVTFSSGEQRNVTLTNGATTATWASPLWAAATANATALSVQPTISGATVPIVLSAIPTGTLAVQGSDPDLYSTLKCTSNLNTSYIVTN